LELALAITRQSVESGQLAPHFIGHAVGKVRVGRVADVSKGSTAMLGLSPMHRPPRSWDRHAKSAPPPIRSPSIRLAAAIGIAERCSIGPQYPHLS